jgi:O-antigen/teichoic acid export membrane protein
VIYKRLDNEMKISKMIWNDDLLRHAGIMFIASIVGGACNYVYQIYIGRALGPEEYGIFGSLFAISYIILILTATIQTSGARYISKFIGEKSIDKISNFIMFQTKRMLILGFSLFFIIILLSNWLSSFLKIYSYVPFLVLSSVFLFSTILPVNLGVLQGLQKFKTLGFNDVLNFSSKLLFGILLVSIGFGVNGAIGAITIGYAIALVASFFPIRRYFYKDSINKLDLKFSEIYRYNFVALIAMFCYTVPGNVDLIIAKHFFDPYIAGLYTSATVLGKIILFIPGSIVVAMFPKVSKLHAEKKNIKNILLKSLLFTSVSSGFFAMIYWFFPYILIKIPYGIEFIDAAPVLQLYGLVMFFFSLTVVIMRYNLAIHNLNYVYLFLLFTISEIVLLTIFHSSMLEMVKILLIVNIILFISSYLYIERNRLDKVFRRWKLSD